MTPDEVRDAFVKLDYRLLRMELKIAGLAEAAAVDFTAMDQDLDQELAEELAKIN